MAQSKAIGTTRPRWTIDRLLDKAERLMQMKGSTASAAVQGSMPDELLAIPMDDLRALVESALIQKLGQRRSRNRYKDNETRAREVQQMTQKVMKSINAEVERKAEVLARVTYVVKGVPTPLLTMVLEDHIAKKMEASRTARNAEGRRAFHSAAVAALRKGNAERISELPTSQIATLAERAQAVWGE